MRATASTLTDDQMLAQRSAEQRKEVTQTNHEVIYAIDRVLGHATVPEHEGDRAMIATAINADHDAEVRHRTSRMMSIATRVGATGLDAATLAELYRRGAMTSREDRVWLRIHVGLVEDTSPRVAEILRRLVNSHEDVDNSAA